MGCEKISYKEQEGVLRQSAIFLGGALEKRGYAEKICVKAYRYGFNGKERDNNQEWGQTSYDYGFRIYNPAIAKFLSVDPLTKSYPMLTPYQFASNTPIQAIDLDGLEAFYVHGTVHGADAWTQPELQSTNAELLKLTNNKTKDMSFSWRRPFSSYSFEKGGWNDNPYSPLSDNLNWQVNNKEDRRLAANLLVNHVISFRKKNNIIDEEITFVAYSHGGNVAIQAAEILNEEYGVQVNIISVNTPSYNGENNVENPGSSYGVNDLIEFYTKGDNVVDVLAGGSEKHDDVRIMFIQTHQIEPSNGDVTGVSNHFLENVQSSEIKKSGVKKLKPVNKSRRNPDLNKKRTYSGKKDN